jgi:peptidyl-prolyl cis-trans isomerase SurA
MTLSEMLAATLSARRSRSRTTVGRTPIRIVLLTGAIAAGCHRAYGPDVVATVNGSPVHLSEVEKAYKEGLSVNKEQPTRQQAEFARLAILRELIDDEILSEEAKRVKLVASDDEVDAKLTEMRALYTQEEFDRKLQASSISLNDLRQQIRRYLTSEKLLNKKVTSRINITDEDISDFYEVNKEQFNFAEPMYNIAEIVVTSSPRRIDERSDVQSIKASNDAEARNKIDILHNRLESGEDFGSVAMKFSESDDAANGGTKGFISESSLRRNPSVFAAILKIQPGEMTEVFYFTAPGSDSRPVYAIYKLLEKEAAGQRELSDPRVQQDIRQRLRDSRTQLLKAAYYEIVRNQAHVEDYLARRTFSH